MPIRTVADLSQEEKILLLKELFDNLDIVYTGAYGAIERAQSNDIRLATEVDQHFDYLIVKDQTVIINTGIMTG